MMSVVGDLAPHKNALLLWLQPSLVLPSPLPKLLNALTGRLKRRGPAGMWVATVGTVGVTAVGIFGSGSGWGLTPAGYIIWLIVGGIARKPSVVGGRIEPRETLHLTVGLDHDIVDGAPAARFTRRLVELIESGFGLDQGALHQTV
jgi:hypothetical protein